MAEEETTLQDLGSLVSVQLSDVAALRSAIAKRTSATVLEISNLTAATISRAERLSLRELKDCLQTLETLQSKLSGRHGFIPGRVLFSSTSVLLEDGHYLVFLLEPLSREYLSYVCFKLRWSKIICNNHFVNEPREERIL